MKMIKPSIPFNFVFDYLPAAIIIKPMFGMSAIYLNEQIMFILRNKAADPDLNGIWLATNKEHLISLKQDFPSLKPILRLSKNKGETTWQLLSANADDFEESLISICELIKRRDIRIGRMPKKN
jgi:hypothetical protein